MQGRRVRRGTWYYIVRVRAAVLSPAALNPMCPAGAQPWHEVLSAPKPFRVGALISGGSHSFQRSKIDETFVLSLPHVRFPILVCLGEAGTILLPLYAAVWTLSTTRFCQEELHFCPPVHARLVKRAATSKLTPYCILYSFWIVESLKADSASVIRFNRFPFHLGPVCLQRRLSRRHALLWPPNRVERLPDCSIGQKSACSRSGGIVTQNRLKLRGKKPTLVNKIRTSFHSKHPEHNKKDVFALMPLPRVHTGTAYFPVDRYIVQISSSTHDTEFFSFRVTTILSP